MNATIYVHGMMLLMIALVASSFPVGKLISDLLPADVLMFIRFTIATLLFIPFVWVRYGLSLPSLRRLIAYATLSLPLVGFFWCMFEALRYTNALNTGAIYTMVPALTAIYSWLLTKEQTGRKVLCGLLIGMVGALWIVFRGDINAVVSLELNRGDFLFFIGCLCMGLYKPLVKKLYQKEPIMVMTFWVTLCGAVWLMLLSIPEWDDVVWKDIELSTLGWLLYLAVFTTLLSFFLVQYGTVHIGAVNVAAYSFLTPIFVLGLGWWSGDEKVNLSVVPGCLLVMVAMWLVQVRHKPHQPIKSRVSDDSKAKCVS